MALMVLLMMVMYIIVSSHGVDNVFGFMVLWMICYFMISVIASPIRALWIAFDRATESQEGKTRNVMETTWSFSIINGVISFLLTCFFIYSLADFKD